MLQLLNRAFRLKSSYKAGPGRKEGSMNPITNKTEALRFARGQGETVSHPIGKVISKFVPFADPSKALAVCAKSWVVQWIGLISYNS